MTTQQIRHTTSARIPTDVGQFQLHLYVDEYSHKEHLALVIGDLHGEHGVLTRVHSECFTGDVLGSQRCDCGEQLQSAMRLIAHAGRGIIIYLRQEGRGIGLEQKLRAYNLQDQGYDTVDANLLLGHQADKREYSAAAAILRDQDVRSIRLLTNNPAKIDHLRGLGIRTSRNALPHQGETTKENASYLHTKVTRMRHLLTLPSIAQHQPPTEFPAELLLDPAISGQLETLKERIRTHQRHYRRPFVTVSYAQSLDGSIAAFAPDGGAAAQHDAAPTQISSPASMVVTHALRTQHDAILVGSGTMLTDDPRLTARLADGAPRAPEPQPVIVSGRRSLPTTARVFSHPKSAWIATTEQRANLFPEAAAPGGLSTLGVGARLIVVPSLESGDVDLAALLDRLGELGIGSVMVEGGARILSSFLGMGLADYAVITVAPTYLGGLNVLARPLSTFQPALRPTLTDVTTCPVGGDTIISGLTCAERLAKVMDGQI